MLATGTEVGGYRIEGVLGRGGMGVVYEAEQLSLGRIVALKLLASELTDDAAFRERFRREARMQAIIDHAHIVPVFEAGELDEGLYISMRLVRGSNLRQLITGGDLTPGRAMRLLMQVADALDTAHEADLIHRDIKPQNILVAARDHAFLADFGLTKGKSDTGYTRTGQLMGTLDYVAPEQIKGELATGGSDIYALSAVAYECLVGRPPFSRPTELATLYAHVNDPPPRASEERPGLPAAVDEVLFRGLAKSPADRPATAVELITDLQAALSRAPALAPPAAEPPPPTPTPATLGVEPLPLDAGQATEIVTSPGIPTRQDLRRDWTPEVSEAAAGAAEKLRPAPDSPSTTTEALPAAAAPAARDTPAPAADPPEVAPATAAPLTDAPAALATPPAARRVARRAAPGPATAAARRRRWSVVVGAVAVVGAAALGLLLGGGSTAPAPAAKRPQVGSGAVAVQRPAGWRAASDVTVPGLTLRDAGAATDGRGAVVVGISDGSGPTLLPADFRKRLPSTPKPTAVKLGDLEAYRYDDLHPTGTPGPVSVYVAPIGKGVVTLACRGTDGRTCGEAAATLTARGLTPIPLGPHAEYATALTTALRPLERDRAAAERKLATAKRPHEQAAAAAQIAATYETAAGRLSNAPVAPLEADAHPALVKAARQAHRAWQQLAGAARTNARSRYAAQRDRVRSAEQRVSFALSALADLGYEVR